MWRSLTADGNVRWLKYSWGPASASSLAIRLPHRGWLVVSAPVGASASAADELEADGGVALLLAPNAYHHLGQRAWRRRFPTATSWAPRSAHPRLTAKSKDIPYGAAEDLAAELSPHIEVVAPDGQKTTDLLLRTETGGDVVWWLGDLFSNTGPADAIWPLRLLARLAGSGPGFRRNTKPGLVYVRDQATWLASVRSALTPRLPTIAVPAHGDPLADAAAARTAALLV